MPVEMGPVGVAVAAVMKSMEAAVTIAAAVNGKAAGSESATTKTAAMESTAMKAATAEAATMESTAVATTPTAAVSDHRRQSVGCVFRRGYRSRARQGQRLGTLRYSCEREYRRCCDAEAANHAASRTGVVHC